MNILSAIVRFFTNDRQARYSELRQFAKSEWKNDWEWAYQSMKLRKKLPPNR